MSFSIRHTSAPHTWGNARRPHHGLFGLIPAVRFGLNGCQPVDQSYNYVPSLDFFCPLEKFLNHFLWAQFVIIFLPYIFFKTLRPKLLFFSLLFYTIIFVRQVVTFFFPKKMVAFFTSYFFFFLFFFIFGGEPSFFLFRCQPSFGRCQPSFGLGTTTNFFQDFLLSFRVLLQVSYN